MDVLFSEDDRNVQEDNKDGWADDQTPKPREEDIKAADEDAVKPKIRLIDQIPNTQLLDQLPFQKYRTRVVDTHKHQPQSYLFTGQDDKLIQEFPK